MIRVGNTLIINGDEKTDLDEVMDESLCVLTCGLSRKSTVTASSIGESGFVFCLQREVFALDGRLLTPQEFNVCWKKEPEDIYPYLAVVMLLLMLGVSVDIFKGLKF